MFKKIAAIVLLLALALSLCACGKKPSEPLKIGIPDDATNGGRAIKLLETAGLITVDPAAGWTPELKDVTSYIYNIEIVPTTANTLPSTLDDYAAATINGTYAVPVGLAPSKDGLIIESQEGASEGGENPYVNIVCARSDDRDNELYKTIQAAFQTDLVAQYLTAKYKEAYLPAFDYSKTDKSDEEILALIDGYKSDAEGKTVVKVGVCGASNEHWNACQYVLDEQDAGIYLDLIVFNAYNLPNEALNSGDIDLNSFQHKAYLATEVNSQGYAVETIFDTIMAPLTLYSNKFDSLDALREAAGKK